VDDEARSMEAEKKKQSKAGWTGKKVLLCLSLLFLPLEKAVIFISAARATPPLLGHSIRSQRFMSSCVSSLVKKESAAAYGENCQLSMRDLRVLLEQQLLSDRQACFFEYGLGTRERFVTRPFVFC
jgi:hypothetical protein